MLSAVSCFVLRADAKGISHLECKIKHTASRFVKQNIGLRICIELCQFPRCSRSCNLTEDKLGSTTPRPQCVLEDICGKKNRKSTLSQRDRCHVQDPPEFGGLIERERKQITEIVCVCVSMCKREGLLGHPRWYTCQIFSQNKSGPSAWQAFFRPL